MYLQKVVPEHHVEQCYSVDTYKNVYAYAIYGVNGEQLWGHLDFILPLPPNFGRGVGRPSRAKRRENDEPVAKHKKKVRRQRSAIETNIPNIDLNNEHPPNSGDVMPKPSLRPVPQPASIMTRPYQSEDVMPIAKCQWPKTHPPHSVATPNTCADNFVIEAKIDPSFKI
ncbi:hypothetical protein DH2020_001753 [Rehmannia glutinosa]|uniref:Uncharacterized protein n=1 Tax=Rehmannia glutinosa TaxID=99300 RepID=A0ABR0XRW2_REHGL